MIFASDNWAGAHPDIARGLTEHAGGFDRAYGDGALDQQVKDRFSAIFEREVHVFFVGTGTAANSIAMTACNKPGGVAFAHRHAHVIEDECGAPEYFMGGSRLHAVDGPSGRITPETLEAAIAHFPAGFVHAGRPIAVSITQATEIGTVYDLDQIEAIAAVARKAELPLHMDGARFANALVSLDVSPAEMTWKRGVDLLSFGGTKNGCWCAEAVVLFDDRMATELLFIRKRAAQLFSKSRFIAAQFDAYLRDDLWLRLARHANARTAELANILRGSNRARLGWEPQANEIFAILRNVDAARLQKEGAVFYPWNLPDGSTIEMDGDERFYRFVTSFATTADDVARVGELLRS